MAWKWNALDSVQSGNMLSSYCPTCEVKLWSWMVSFMVPLGRHHPGRFKRFVDWIFRKLSYFWNGCLICCLFIEFTSPSDRNLLDLRRWTSGLANFRGILFGFGRPRFGFKIGRCFKQHFRAFGSMLLSIKYLYQWIHPTLGSNYGSCHHATDSPQVFVFVSKFGWFQMVSYVPWVKNLI